MELSRKTKGYIYQEVEKEEFLLESTLIYFIYDKGFEKKEVIGYLDLKKLVLKEMDIAEKKIIANKTSGNYREYSRSLSRRRGCRQRPIRFI